MKMMINKMKNKSDEVNVVKNEKNDSPIVKEYNFLMVGVMMSGYKREWKKQETSRQEVRQEIRREFNKQEQGRGRKGHERSKDMVRLHQGDFAVNPNPPRAQKAPAPVVAPSPPVREQREGKEEKLVHGDLCKTCVRMNKLTGHVLPHSPNY